MYDYFGMWRSFENFWLKMWLYYVMTFCWNCRRCWWRQVALWHCVQFMLCPNGNVSEWQCVRMALYPNNDVSKWWCVRMALCQNAVVSWWHCVIMAIYLVPFCRVTSFTVANRLTIVKGCAACMEARLPPYNEEMQKKGQILSTKKKKREKKPDFKIHINHMSLFIQTKTD